MIPLQQFVNSIITEHKADMMPKCIIMMGGPGAGKSTWMKNDAKKFFPDMKQYKMLDSDHNLEAVQRENEREMALKILEICKKKKSDDVKMKEFKKYIERRELEMNAVSSLNESPEVDLTQIDFGFCNEKGIEAAKLSGQALTRFENQYCIDFHTKYWKKIFASDFSRRPLSKRDYKETYFKKLSGCAKEDVESLGLEEAFFREIEAGTLDSTSDIVLAICGDEKADFEKPAKLCQGRYAIYVIYLDVPLELSIERNAKRDRSVHTDVCKKKIEGCKKTWELLKKDFENLGIWQMYRFEWHNNENKTIYKKNKGAAPTKVELKGSWGKPVESYTNQKMLKSMAGK